MKRAMNIRMGYQNWNQLSIPKRNELSTLEWAMRQNGPSTPNGLSTSNRGIGVGVDYDARTGYYIQAM